MIFVFNDGIGNDENMLADIKIRCKTQKKQACRERTSRRESPVVGVKKKGVKATWQIEELSEIELN